MLVVLTMSLHETPGYRRAHKLFLMPGGYPILISLLKLSELARLLLRLIVGELP